MSQGYAHHYNREKNCRLATYNLSPGSRAAATVPQLPEARLQPPP